MVELETDSNDHRIMDLKTNGIDNKAMDLKANGIDKYWINQLTSIKLINLKIAFILKIY